MADIRKSNQGGRAKVYSDSSKRFIGLPNNDTITESMLKDHIINDNKLAPEYKRTSIVVSGDHTVQTGDGHNVIMFDDTSTDRVCNLPEAASNTDRVLLLKNISSDKGKITVTPNGAEKIEGYDFIDLDCKGARIKIVSDGSNWQVLEHFFTDKVYDRSAVGQVTATNWTTVYANFEPTRNLAGQWFLEVHVRGGINPSADSINDIEFSEVNTIRDETIALYGARASSNRLAPSVYTRTEGNIAMQNNHTAAFWQFGGTFDLQHGKPDFVE